MEVWSAEHVEQRGSGCGPLQMAAMTAGISSSLISRKLSAVRRSSVVSILRITRPSVAFILLSTFWMGCKATTSGIGRDLTGSWLVAALARRSPVT
jgi:predicted small secreted protein